VVASIYVVTDKYPDAWIQATGSTKARTRLYRMGIVKYWHEANNDFYILGLLNSEWKQFVIGIDYDAFAVKRKLRNFEL
jgi:hypothetical protein